MATKLDPDFADHITVTTVISLSLVGRLLVLIGFCPVLTTQSQLVPAPNLMFLRSRVYVKSLTYLPPKWIAWLIREPKSNQTGSASKTSS